MFAAQVKIDQKLGNGKVRTYKYSFPAGVGKTSDVSDGYHTFAEMYQYRMLLQAMLFNQWAARDKWNSEEPNYDPLQSFNVHKSYRHHDGELCFGKENYFIVMATLPGIGQISNHYKGEHWDLFAVPEQEFADEYDGHTPQEAAQRMEDYIKKSIDKL